MMIDFNQRILKEDGTPSVSKTKITEHSKADDGSIIERDSFIVGELTLKDVCTQALLKGANKIPLQETMFRYHLSKKISGGGSVRLINDEIKKLKELINDRYEIILAGQALIMLGEK